MSFEAYLWAKKQRGLSDKGKLLLREMADLVDPNHLCWASHAYWAQELECSTRQVRRCVAELTEKGLLEDTGKRVGRSKRVIVYRLKVTYPRPCADYDDADDEIGTGPGPDLDDVENLQSNQEYAQMRTEMSASKVPRAEDADISGQRCGHLRSEMRTDLSYVPYNYPVNTLGEGGVDISPARAHTRGEPPPPPSTQDTQAGDELKPEPAKVMTWLMNASPFSCRRRMLNQLRSPEELQRIQGWLDRGVGWAQLQEARDKLIEAHTAAGILEALWPRLVEPVLFEQPLKPAAMGRDLPSYEERMARIAATCRRLDERDAARAAG